MKDYLLMCKIWGKKGGGGGAICSNIPKYSIIFKDAHFCFQKKRIEILKSFEVSIWYQSLQARTKWLTYQRADTK